jgi:hypothetical protein
MRVADNVVFIGLAPAWFVRARQEDMRQARFALVELCALPIPPDWPQFGIELTAGWARRGRQGAIAHTRLLEESPQAARCREKGSKSRLDPLSMSFRRPLLSPAPVRFSNRNWRRLHRTEAMILSYSTGGKPLVPLSLTLGQISLSVEGLLDSGSDVNVLPFGIGSALIRLDGLELSC